MRIEIRLCNTLAQCRRGGGSFSLMLPEGATVDDALKRMSLRQSRLAAVLCNGETVMCGAGEPSGSRRLREGDHLVISAHDPSAMSMRPCLGLTALIAGWRRISSLLSPLVQTR